MGQLIADLFITLDGFARGEGAPAYYGYPGPELERWVDEHLATPQVLLMGRVTYEALSGIAQNHPVEGPDRMSELPKVVFSRTLQEPLAWNNSRVARVSPHYRPANGLGRSNRKHCSRSRGPPLCGGWRDYVSPRRLS
jgi:dihydrofolate reductase